MQLYRPQITKHLAERSPKGLLGCMFMIFQDVQPNVWDFSKHYIKLLKNIWLDI